MSRRLAITIEADDGRLTNVTGSIGRIHTCIAVTVDSTVIDFFGRAVTTATATTTADISMSEHRSSGRWWWRDTRRLQCPEQCEVHLNGAPPVTAICSDVVYSCSQNRQGTCSSHGAVKCWVCPGRLCNGLTEADGLSMSVVPDGR